MVWCRHSLLVSVVEACDDVVKGMEDEVEVTVSFQIFRSLSFMSFFLSKIVLKKFFVKSQHSVLKLCHLTFFSDKKIEKKKFEKKIEKKFVKSQLSLLDFHHLTIFFQRHESIGDLA